MAAVELGISVAIIALLLGLLVAAVAAQRSASAERHVRRADEARRSVLLERQLALLEGLQEKTATGVRAGVEASLLPVLEKMGGTLDRLALDIHTAQREGLEEIAANFREQLSAGFREEFDSLARALHEAAAWQERVHEDLGRLLATSSELTDAHQSMLRRTLQASEAVRGNAESLSRAERSLAQVADRVQAASARMLESMEGTTRNLLQQIQATSTELSTQLRELSGVLNEQMEQGSEQLTRRIQGMSLMLQRVASDIESLGRDQRARPPGSGFPRSY